MKRNIFIISGCIMLLSLTTSAYGAEEKTYLSASFFGLGIFSDAEVSNSKASTTDFTVEADTGFAVGAALGYDFYGFPRIEAEIAYQNNALDKVRTTSGDIYLHDNIDSLAFLVNGYWDFTNRSFWTPYLSAGLGAALINVDDNTAYLGNDSATVFAYQFGAGLGYAINEEITLEGKYRYFATTNAEFASGEVEYASHNVYAGMRYSF
ncbi:MAG: outer membrane beta-barrel protein [Desulfurivibrionaceae bacterium]